LEMGRVVEKDGVFWRWVEWWRRMEIVGDG
jgi:hypothetical protein